VILRHLHNVVQRKWPEMSTAWRWLLHHDNAPAHTALSITQLLPKLSIPTLPQPPSPDLSPPDFYLFPKLKIAFKERFQTVEDIIIHVTNNLTQTSSEQCFQKWTRQWERCIAVPVDYFHGNNIQ
jgi:hypothetical protein